MGYSKIVALGIGALLTALPAGILWAAQPQMASSKRGAVVIVEIGTEGGDLSTHELTGIGEGPPGKEPQWLEVKGVQRTIGATAGILDSEQQVVELHLHHQEGEIFARLLIEPDVSGFADLGPDTSIVVHLQSIRRSGAARTEASSLTSN